MEFNPQIQLAGLLEWMAEQMHACHGKTAVIGISGGKDSSTVAALAVAAYGKENVMGVLMPDGVQPDIDYSHGLVDTLGRAFLPTLLRLLLPTAHADALAASLASIAIYLLMAGVLIWRPRGLFPAQA